MLRLPNLTEAGLTYMISNSRLPDKYEPGHFHIFAIGMYVIVKPKIASIFSGLGKHSGTPPIALDGIELARDSSRFMIVCYCPKSILSPDGNSIPLLKLPPLSPSCSRMIQNILACSGPLFLTAVTFHHSLMSAVTVHHSLMTAVTVIVL